MPPIQIAELKKISLNAMTLTDHLNAMPKDQPTIIMRSFPKAPTAPTLQPGVKVYDKIVQTPQDVQNAYGTHPNVSGTEVINAILAFLGGGNWDFHVSDGSYTAYSAFELQEYIGNFDSTNLDVWIAETFDCDNFACVLNGSVQGFYKGIPFGILWFGPRNPPFSWGHAVNIFYDAYAKKVYCVEPQTDGFFNFDKINWVPWMVLI
ncbi:MAG TPA: hypothetical protein VLU95_04180 [Candidatus Acidoferrum sp.]|nr:hypothetical protein [Candidatus Acidoferrum sp.]